MPKIYRQFDEVQIGVLQLFLGGYLEDDFTGKKNIMACLKVAYEGAHDFV